MSRGIEKSVKIHIYPTRKDFQSDYVVNSLFNLSKRSEGKQFGEKAKQILEKAYKKGNEGLQAADWKVVHEELGVSQSQYFYIIHTLKAAGLLRKTKGRYYVTKTLAEHLYNMSAALNAMFSDWGIRDS